MLLLLLVVVVVVDDDKRFSKIVGDDDNDNDGNDATAPCCNAVAADAMLAVWIMFLAHWLATVRIRAEEAAATIIPGATTNMLLVPCGICCFPNRKTEQIFGTVHGTYVQF